MFEMVLKFGAYVVDQLCKYLHPVIVYIPPHGELRGGAWAVVDPSINPACMHMYADPRSRGGVLEPEGTVQVKLRKVGQQYYYGHIKSASFTTPDRLLFRSIHSGQKAK